MPAAEALCPKDMVYVPEGTYYKQKIPALCVDEHEFTNGDFERLAKQFANSFQLWSVNKKGKLLKLIDVGDPNALWGKYARTAPNLKRGVAGYLLKPSIPLLSSLSTSPPGYDGLQQPMVRVTGYQAKQLCELQKKRLPTPREWTSIASNSGTQNYSTYSGKLDDGVHYNSLDTRNVCAARGHYVKYGGKEVCDMNGNVWEWTFDSKAVPSLRFYVSGGSYLGDPDNLTADFRLIYSPTVTTIYDIGFRCVMKPRALPTPIIATSKP